MGLYLRPAFNYFNRFERLFPSFFKETRLSFLERILLASTLNSLAAASLLFASAQATALSLKETS